MELIDKERGVLVIRRNEEVSEINKALSDYKNVTYVDSSSFNDLEELFDAIITDETSDNITNLISKIYKNLKPGGIFLVSPYSNDSNLEFVLKTNGLINVAVQKSGEITAYKPSYTLGSYVKLNISKPVATNAIWKVNSNVEDDVEIIDPDDLLDEDDFKKPDESSLRVCGTTGKRKACKDCSCGLAEELDAERVDEKTVNSAEAKSSCGSCYLGDAFRCATCPYLGMPAFKPGEKVQLTDGLLKADI